MISQAFFVRKGSRLYLLHNALGVSNQLAPGVSPQGVHEKPAGDGSHRRVERNRSRSDFICDAIYGAMPFMVRRPAQWVASYASIPTGC
jgi:hypothetical protein